MAWTAPRTWTTAEVVTAAIMNTHVRDNETFLKTAHGSKVYSSTATILTLTTATAAAVPFNSEVFDTDAYHDTVTNNSRITIPTGLDGVYLVGGNAEFASNATNGRISKVQKNGATDVGLARIPGAASGLTRVLVVTMVSLVASDYVELNVTQDSGGNLALNGGAESDTQFFAELVGS